ncbi:MAG: hypothetical protein AAF607_03000 [Pseudomonadota bacterium]
MTRPQLRALTITLADIASERVVAHCSQIPSARVPYILRASAQIKAYFDPLRPAATDVLIDQYAPYLKSQKTLATRAVEPVVELILQSFALNKLSAEDCEGTDIALEAFSVLPAEKTADVLTLSMARLADLDDDADNPFRLCADQMP